MCHIWISPKQQCYSTADATFDYSTVARIQTGKIPATLECSTVARIWVGFKSHLTVGLARIHVKFLSFICAIARVWGRQTLSKLRLWSSSNVT
jgi:hypothetical protein